MRNIVLLLLFCITLLSAEVNECKSDVYFGNGILTKERSAEGSAEDNARLLEDAIIEKFGLDYYRKHIGKVDYAYNRTDGAIVDLIWLQCENQELQIL